MRTTIRRMAGLAVAATMVVGLTGALAAPASAASSTKKFKTAATFTTTALGVGGAFTASLPGTGPNGAVSDAAMSGISTTGPKSVTKTVVKLTNVAVSSTGTPGGFTADITAPWMTGTVTGTVTSPPGYGPPTSIDKFSIKCVCTFNGNDKSWTWTWTFKLNWSASSAV